jgi:hypothetical protein
VYDDCRGRGRAEDALNQVWEVIRKIAQLVLLLPFGVCGRFRRLERHLVLWVPDQYVTQHSTTISVKSDHRTTTILVKYDQTDKNKIVNCDHSTTPF